MSIKMPFENLFSDIQLIKNISGGSGAQTWIAEDHHKLKFVRKWGHGSIGEKLKKQVLWLAENSKHFYCPQVLKDCSDKDLYFYDMNYIQPSKTLIQFARNTDPLSVAQITLEALSGLQQRMQNFACGQDLVSRKKYLNEKLFLNLDQFTKADSSFLKLMNYNTVVVQGRPLKGFQKLMSSLNIQNTFDSLLAEDLFSFGHGDLTLSNILISEGKVYLIDPNPAFGTISLCQEFSKVLQSTRIRYEDFDQIANLDANANRLDYSMPQNFELAEMNKHIVGSDFYRAFNSDLLLLHLAIHLCRIIPYVYNQKRKYFLIYFAEVLKILNAIDANESQSYLEGLG